MTLTYERNIDPTNRMLGNGMWVAVDGLSKMFVQVDPTTQQARTID